MEALEWLKTLVRFWRGTGDVGEGLKVLEGFWRGSRDFGDVAGVLEVMERFVVDREVVEGLEIVVENFGDFWRFWGGLEVLRLWGGLEVVQRQVLELGLCLIHWHIQAVSPHLLLPGQSHHPTWPRSSVFPGGRSRTGASCGQCSAEGMEIKSSVTENPPGDPTGLLSPKLLTEP